MHLMLITLNKGCNEMLHTLQSSYLTMTVFTCLLSLTLPYSLQLFLPLPTSPSLSLILPPSP